MDIQRIRTSTYNPMGSSQRTTENQYVDINLDSRILELMCKMLVTDNKNIRRTQLTNIKKYISIIDPAKYVEDFDKKKYISFIQKGLEARLDFNLVEPYLILSHINGGLLDDGVVDINNFKGLGGAEVDWLNSMVAETVKYSHVFQSVNEMSDICNRFKIDEYKSKTALVAEFEGMINNIQNNFRRARNETHTEALFTLAGNAFTDVMHDIHNQLCSPRRKLITGMQGLNELLGGGFECGRCYSIFGLPGEGKSIILLNLAYQIKKYNTNYRCKDPTKIPTVVLLTMENTVAESVERLFGVSGSGNKPIVEYDVNEVIARMQNEGGLFIDENSPINIVFKLVPTNSVDTSYLYTLTEDLEDMGYETIAVVQDYIGRIRSTERYADVRLEYGAVVDEFKIFAELKDVPVITASQLNRDASKHIDEGRKNNQADLVRSLGRSNVSESMLVLNNLDAAFLIAPEYTNEGIKYMGIQRVKIRYNASDMSYVYLPFKRGSISFEEDEGTFPVYKTSLREDANDIGGSGTYTKYSTNVVTDMNVSASTKKSSEIGGIFRAASSVMAGRDPMADYTVTSSRSIEDVRRTIEKKMSNRENYCPIIFFEDDGVA